MPSSLSKTRECSRKVAAEFNKNEGFFSHSILAECWCYMNNFEFFQNVFKLLEVLNEYGWPEFHFLRSFLSQLFSVLIESSTAVDDIVILLSQL